MIYGLQAVFLYLGNINYEAIRDQFVILLITKILSYNVSEKRNFYYDYEMSLVKRTLLLNGILVKRWILQDLQRM